MKENKKKNINKKKSALILIIFLILTFFASKKIYNFLLGLAPENYNFLNVGDVAPNFEAICVNKDNNFKTKKIKLTDFRGKKIIFYYYPADGTPFCTLQAKSLRDNYEELVKNGFDVIGISTDTIQSHINFIREHDLPFTLISDMDHKIHDKYGAWGLKALFFKKFWKTYRITFVIDENGIISQIHTKNKNLIKNILKQNKNQSKLSD